MRLNKKGFAVSAILYSLLIIFLLLIVLIYALFDSNNGLFNMSLDDIIDADIWTAASANINLAEGGGIEVIDNNTYKITQLSDVVLPTIDLTGTTNTATITTSGIINPYIPGNYNITYTIKDVEGNILPEPNDERTITLVVSEPEILQVTDPEPGIFAETGVADGTSAKPYLIRSIEDLVALTLNVYKGTTYSGSYFKIVNNLDFSDDKSYINPNINIFNTEEYTATGLVDMNGNSTIEGIKTEVTTGKGFYPIGNSTNKFSGYFDGNFMVIKNLLINRPDIDNCGLIGYYYKSSLDPTGIVKNISLYNANIVGKSNTGGIIGKSDRINFYNSKVLDSVVTGTSNVGLAIGYGNHIKIIGCIVKGDVRGTASVGGMIGYLYGSDWIIRGVNIGGSIDGVTESDCASACYRLVGSAYSAPTYFDNKFSVFSDPSVILNGGTLPNTYTSYNYNGSNINNISGINNINLLNMIYDTYILNDNDGDGYYFDYYDDNSNLIVLKSTATTPIVFDLEGVGTVADPYRINNYSDLKKMTLVTNTAKNFILMQDIDLANKNFYMFGTFGDVYNSTFDGNSHKISNVNLDIPSASFIGLTAWNNGTIKGLYIDNIIINGSHWIGGITGFNYGTINDIVIKNANITAFSRAGIITGENYYNKPILSVIVDGSLSGTTYVGGIAGYTQSNNIKGVIRDGVITSTSATEVGRIYGGIYGNTTNIYCYSLYIANEKIKVNNTAVSNTTYTAKHGKDASPADLADLTIYTNAGFNTADETKYIWYVDNGVVKFRKGTSMP